MERTYVKLWVFGQEVKKTQTAHSLQPENPELDINLADPWV